MTTEHLPILTTPQAFCRFRRVGDRFVVTGLDGSFALLDDEEWARFRAGDVVPGSPLHDRLSAANLWRSTFDAGRAQTRVAKRKEFLRYGPNLHILIVTLRCNQTCVYCHASRAGMEAVQTDMTPEVAERSIDLALSSTSPGITIEFQGGEPLAHFSLVRHAIEYALERNRSLGKTLDFALVSNLTLMDDEKLAYLLDKRVQICTSVDGPADLHDKQRVLVGRSAHSLALRWIEKINSAYVKSGLDPETYHVEALLTTTREALRRPREIVDTYVSIGCRALFLRPVDPFGFAEKTASRVEYPRAEYLAFYREAVDYMISLNRKGTPILERFAGIFLTKILAGEDPNFLDIRSPCGAGIGQLAYNYDGRVFTCDEGRMLHEMGDDTFEIGHVSKSSYPDLIKHDTVRTLLVASNLDVQPSCMNCAYQPYCGVCPVHSHRTQGTLWGRMPESSLCAVHMGIQDYLFEKLSSDPTVKEEVFSRWISVRNRSHFLQTCQSGGAT